MSSSYSPTDYNFQAEYEQGFQSEQNTPIRQETSVIKSHVPLAISTSLTTAIYSYSMIDGSMSNAINRALFMALSTFLSASAVYLLENYNYVTKYSVSSQYAEGALIPAIYYLITKRQLQLPDMDSQVVKTGVISAVVGEFSKTYLEKKYLQYEYNTPYLANPTPSVPSSNCNC